MDYREGIQVLRESRVYAPALVHYNGAYHVFSRTKWVSSGASIVEALKAGGFLPRPDLRMAVFTAKDCVVVYKGVPVATADSKNMAVRIANALNEYTAGERGH
jgi:hypothetical protein